MKQFTVALSDGQNYTFSLNGLDLDSRKIDQGFLFAALPGVKVDGRNFIEAAISKGATYILSPTIETVPEHVTLIQSNAPRKDFARITHGYYQAQPEKIIAVTGTNGKSSTARFTEQLWGLLQKQAASLGTIGLSCPYRQEYGSLTTPDPITLHQLLKELKEHDVTHLALEASSHGLDQNRLEAVKLTAAAFTNLSRDHLDYHPTMDAYFKAKAQLFSELLPSNGTAVLNADIPETEKLLKLCRAKGQHITLYGRQAEKYAQAGERSLTIQTLEPHAKGLFLELKDQEITYQLNIPLVGTFQAENLLCSLGLVLATTSEPAATVIPLLEKLSGVCGRMELAGHTAKGAAIYIDYAHTPDALETVLTSIRPHCENRLVALFGCGGDRDKGKRPEMGRVCTEFADLTILTDDNPRTEDPATIRQDARIGCPDALEIAPREVAISKAIDLLEAGDILVVAGKGHEQGQIIGTDILPFDDKEQVQKHPEVEA